MLLDSYMASKPFKPASVLSYRKISTKGDMNYK